jgi:FixJ family two-component response regulator
VPHPRYKACRRKSNFTETTPLEELDLQPTGDGRSQRSSSMVSTKYPVVAVIADDPCVLDALTCVLPTHGFDVELYVSPGKFLEAVMMTQASCLIVDVHLAGGCGVEFVRQLANRGVTFPVIFIGDEEAERRAMETARCVAFFRKPFSAYLLIEALYDFADSYSTRQSGI